MTPPSACVCGGRATSSAAGIEERTASRDLKALVDVGLLAWEASKGRFYRASGPLRELSSESGDAELSLTIPIPGSSTASDRSCLEALTDHVSADAD